MCHHSPYSLTASKHLRHARRGLEIAKLNINVGVV